MQYIFFLVSSTHTFIVSCRWYARCVLSKSRKKQHNLEMKHMRKKRCRVELNASIHSLMSTVTQGSTFLGSDKKRKKNVCLSKVCVCAAFLFMHCGQSFERTLNWKLNAKHFQDKFHMKKFKSDSCEFSC